MAAPEGSVQSLLVLRGAGEQDVVLPQGLDDRPVPGSALLRVELGPVVRRQPTGLNDDVARRRAGMTGVEDEDGVWRLQPPEDLRDLVVRDVGHVSEAAVAGDESLVLAVRLVMAPIRRLGAVSGVVEVDHVTRPGRGHESLQRGEDRRASRRLVRQHPDVPRAEPEAGLQDPLHQEHVVDRAPEVRDAGALVVPDPDEKRVAGGRRLVGPPGRVNETRQQGESETDQDGAKQAHGNSPLSCVWPRTRHHELPRIVRLQYAGPP
jgi:hypothetical protein